MAQKQLGLTGNSLKLLAMLCMTLDHMGLILLPQFAFLRVIGRLAFPIFAWMIAEGCHYSRNMGKYWAAVTLVGLLYQAEYIFLWHSLKMNTMLTFSLSLSLCWLLKMAKERGRKVCAYLFPVGLVLLFGITDILPLLLQKTKFGIDYGFIGVLLPVGIYMARDKKMKLFTATVMLCALAIWSGWPIQWASLAAIPLLAMYNGQRGKWKLKWLFYAYYPAHLTVLWVLYLFWK